MSQTKQFSFLTLLLLLISVSFKISSQPSQQTILVFGDSLSAAYNMPVEKGWVNLLNEKLIENKSIFETRNASISGETTSGGLQRFLKQVEISKPKIVILELGANDGLRGFDLNTTRSNLNKMIQISQEHHAKVLLAGIQIPPNYGRSYTRAFNQIFTDLAKKESVSLIPFILEGVATDYSLIQKDRLHPNEQGQKVIVETVWKNLLPLIE
ncbi:MAG: acyl-CoA thioesterase-1 [Polaribacter sp.]|jgi:acyl-CoA thioesterase-1